PAYGPAVAPRVGRQGGDTRGSPRGGRHGRRGPIAVGGGRAIAAKADVAQGRSGPPGAVPARADWDRRRAARAVGIYAFDLAGPWLGLFRVRAPRVPIH